MSQGPKLWEHLLVTLSPTQPLIKQMANLRLIALKRSAKAIAFHFKFPII